MNGHSFFARHGGLLFLFLCRLIFLLLGPKRPLPMGNPVGLVMVPGFEIVSITDPAINRTENLLEQPFCRLVSLTNWAMLTLFEC